MAPRATAPSGRPLLICDVDEVVLHFIQPFEGWLESRGLRFLSHRYKLAGNIAGADGAPLDQARIGPLLQDFFDASVGQQQAVDGAADALARLSAHADVVFLTNLPGSWNEATRGRTLARAGMDYPLFTNTGPKGAAAARLAAGRRAPGRLCRRQPCQPALGCRQPCRVHARPVHCRRTLPRQCRGDRRGRSQDR